MKALILKALKENINHYISGEQISNQIGVSRTAIWKHISELRHEGYHIESSSRKGYRLISAPEHLSAAEIQAELNTNCFGKNIIYYDTITSTNNAAKEAAAKGCDEGTVVIADRQTAEKGRLGRSWVSPPNSGIWMSVVLRPEILPVQAQFITILAAIAVGRAIEQIAGITIGIKWPNDIVINRKKVCGILTEISAEIEQINYIVLGIGVNVNLDKDDFPDDIKHSAASIKSETGSTVSRKKLVVRILENLESLYKNLYKKEFYDNAKADLINEYKKYSVTLGNRVKAIYQNKTIEGYAEDITENGELIIRSDNGEQHTILSGEVSVRGLYGYI